MDNGLAFSSPHEADPDQFLNKAKRLVSDETGVPVDEIYVVWFSKTLQNWKAMISTARPDGRYFEVTYDGDMAGAYVDTYDKVAHTFRADPE